MFITGLQFCHLVIYCSKDDSCYIVEVEYDANTVINNYFPALENVYVNYMIKALLPNNTLSMQEDGNKENCDNN